MKSPVSLQVLLAAAILGTALSAHAADNTWGGATGNWIDATKWAGGVIIPGGTNDDTNTDVATFGTIGAANTVTVDADRSIGGITFSGTGNFAYALTGGSLKLNDGGIIQNLSTTSATANRIDAISTAITLTGATASFTANSTSSFVFLRPNTVTGSATTGNTTTLTLNGTNTNTNYVTGVISDGANGGTLALVKSGAGQWVLGNATASTYSGGTTINGGILGIQTNNAALGTGLVTLNGGTLQSRDARVIANNFSMGANGGTIDAASNLTLSGTISGSGALTKSGTAQLILSGNVSGFTGTMTVTDGLAVFGAGNSGSAAATFVTGSGAAGQLVMSTGTYTINFGSLSGGGNFRTQTAGSGGTVTASIGALNTDTIFTGSMSQSTSVLAIAKVGTGTLTLSGANSYTGKTSVIAGTLQFAKKASLTNNATPTAANLTVASGATLALNVGGAGEFAVADVNALQSSTFWTAANTATTGLRAGAKIGFDTTNASLGSFTQGNAIADSTGTNGGAIGVTKLGTGTLVLDKANTYTGGTIIKAGTLNAANNSALGSGNGAVAVAGGTLAINDASVSQVTLGTGANLAMSSGKIAIDITGVSTFDKILGTDTGHFTLTGGTLELFGFSGFESNSYELFSGFAGTGNDVTGLSITGYDDTNWLASLGTDGVLSFTAVPEPSTYGLIGAGALAAVAMVRRRRKHAGKVA